MNKDAKRRLDSISWMDRGGLGLSVFLGVFTGNVFFVFLPIAARVAIAGLTAGLLFTLYTYVIKPHLRPSEKPATENSLVKDKHPSE